MRKGFFVGLTGLSVVLAAGALVGFDDVKKAMDFIAPSVNDVDNSSNPISANENIGAIVYDIKDGVMKAATGSGWKSLSESNLSSIYSTELTSDEVLDPNDQENADVFVIADTIASNINITMTASWLKGRQVTFVNNDSAQNAVIKAADSSIIRTVYPGTTSTIIALSTSQDTNADWQGMGVVTSEWQTFTPTITPATSGSITSASGTSGVYRRVGDSIEIMVAYYVDSASSPVGNLQLTLPAGLYHSNTKSLDGYGSKGSGRFFDYSASQNVPIDIQYYNGSSDRTKVIIGCTSSVAIPTPTANDHIHFNAKIPIQDWTTTKG